LRGAKNSPLEVFMTSVGTVISYPTPIYQNLPIEEQFYVPHRYDIEAIALGLTTTVTTTVDHDYVIGQQIRLIIPPSYGSYQLNEVQGYVLSIPQADQVVVSIDTLRNVDAFIASSAPSKAQILAIGDINQGAINANGRDTYITIIPGSFIDISP
jgi:hypothetical protein